MKHLITIDERCIFDVIVDTGIDDEEESRAKAEKVIDELYANGGVIVRDYGSVEVYESGKPTEWQLENLDVYNEEGELIS